MLHLIWFIINVVLLLILIGSCFSVSKLLREKYGRLVSVIFVFGLLAFAGSSVNSGKENNFINKKENWKFADRDTIRSKNFGMVDVVLEENLINKTRFSISYSMSLDSIYSPFDGYFVTLGLIGGTAWKPISVIVDKIPGNNQFQYTVKAVVEWNLLWFTIYSDVKSYNGIAIIRK